MGYTTDFEGSLELSKPLTEGQFRYINAFSTTRHMKRDEDGLRQHFEQNYDKGREKAILSIMHNAEIDIFGKEGEYVVSDQDYDNFRVAIVNHNAPPSTQPGLWCSWCVEELPQKEDEVEKTHVLMWDGSEKFYNYVEWLRYLITNFFEPWGVVLNGDIRWRGEDFEDVGVIRCRDNVVTVKEVEWS